MKSKIINKLVPRKPVSTEPQQELATIEVRDIKQYLVDEYEKVHQLVELNNQLQERLDQAEEIKDMYNAALVTLDEYSLRLKTYENTIAAKDKTIADMKDKQRVLNDELNTYKITLSRAALSKEEIKAEVIKETKDAVIRDLRSHKGALSKAKAIEIVEGSDE